MPKARPALIAAALLVLLAILLTFWAARPSPRISLHYLRARPVGDSMSVSFEVHDPPRHYSGLLPLRLEVMNGSGWEKCTDGIASFSQTDGVRVHAEPTLGCVTKNIPGRRLRLVAQVQCSVGEFDSLFVRLKLRLSGQNRRISLNPFDRTLIILTEPGELVSEEFTLP